MPESELLRELKDARRHIENNLGGLQARMDQMEKEVSDVYTKANRPRLGGRAATSAGSKFVCAEQYKNMLDNHDVNTSPVEVESFHTKALTSEGESGGELIQPDRLPGVAGAPERPMTIRDLLTNRQTASNSVEYVVETGFSPIETALTSAMTATATTAQVENSTGFYRGQSVEVAGQPAIVASVGNSSLTFESAPGAASAGAVVSSKTFAPTPEGMLKPSADIKLDTVTSPVRTIATTIAASVQVLADADSMRQYVDQRLAYAVKLAEEAQILYGNGENPSLQGIMSHPAIQVHTRSSNVSDTKIDAIRRAMTLARVAEYPVSGLVLHPEDLQDLEMTKDADGRYIFISEVSQGGASQIFRVPFVETTAIRPGECLLGAFQMGATVHDRQTASVRVSESHEDYFRRNLVLLRGESRLALSVMRPESFVKVVFD